MLRRGGGVQARAWIQSEWLHAAAFKLPSMGLTEKVFPDPGVPLPALGVSQVPCGSLRSTWNKRQCRCLSVFVPIVSLVCVSISCQVF